MRLMDEREQKIVDAAMAVFSRYGVKRTTMNDIANEAGVVRQTLYNVYANKDEVLRATIRLHAERSLAAIETACARASSLGDQLEIVFKHLVVGPYELVHATPHADEIIEGLNEAAKEELAIAEDRYRKAVEELLAPHAQRIGAAGLSTRGLSDLIVMSWGGIKRKAASRKHLLELLAALKVLILSVSTDPGETSRGL